MVEIRRKVPEGPRASEMLAGVRFSATCGRDAWDSPRDDAHQFMRSRQGSNELIERRLTSDRQNKKRCGWNQGR
jgi:hypothetical protein